MNQGLEKAQELVRELKLLLEKYDVSIDLESDYESNDCVALISLNDGSFYSAELTTVANELTKDTDFVIDAFKVKD